MKHIIKNISFVLLLTFLIGSIFVINVNATGEVRQLKELSTGSIVYDDTWTWEHKTGTDYSSTGTTKYVDWLVVAKNHTGYPSNSVTLLSSELIGKYPFDTTGEDGLNHWGNSNKIRPFLNITFYNKMDSKFQNVILETTLNMKTHDEVNYTTKDKIFLPSKIELGGSESFNVQTIGSNWGYFNNDNSRIAKLENQDWMYWTCSPYRYIANGLAGVREDGNIADYNISSGGGYRGVRPALNLSNDIAVEKQSDGRWKILWNQDPFITLISPTSNSSLNSRQVFLKGVV